MPANPEPSNARWKEFMLLIGALSISLLVLEGVLSFVAPQIKPFSQAFTSSLRMPLQESDYLPVTTPRDRIFRHSTEEFDVEYRFNALGYRGDLPTSIEKEAGTKRILLLGDSFTLGWGSSAPDSFAQQLADQLAPRGYEVINAGYRDAFSPDAYYAYLLEDGLDLDPNIIVIFLFSGNDVGDIAANEWHDLDERQMPTSLTTVRLYTDYDGNFIFPRGSRNEVLGWNYRVPVLRSSRVFIGVTDILRNFLDEDSSADKDYRAYGMFRPPASLEDAWQRFEHTIASLNALCARHSIPLIYFLIPDPYLKSFYDPMEQIVRDSEASLVSLRLAVAPDLFLSEGHLNRRGNDVVTDRVMAALREEL